MKYTFDLPVIFNYDIQQGTLVDQWFEKLMENSPCLVLYHGAAPVAVPIKQSQEFTQELPDLKNGSKTNFLDGRM